MSYSQADRPIRIKTTLGATELLLESFSGSESISDPFQFRVSMVSENAAIDLRGLLRTPVTVYLRLNDGSERYFHGIFQHLIQREIAKDGLVSYEGSIVPMLWFLGLNSDCRIFQNKSVPDIVEQLLKENGVTDFRFATNGTYSPREYCVQYRETHLNFISRLLEEEGIFYYFEYEENKHTVVFSDKSGTLKTCPHQEKAKYSAMAEDSDNDAVSGLDFEEQVMTGKVTLADYNFETPSNDLRVSISGANNFEHADYPGIYGTRNEGDRYARVRLEEFEARRSLVRGRGNCRAFSPGYRFTLEDHYRADMNKGYVLTSVSHTASDTSYRAGRSGEFSYRNSFEAIPQATPFRPIRRARKPIVQGSQTAVVVGKQGEEIWVDKYGRVRVQFFWDRRGKKDENSSCWMRVSQIWAGKNWGWMTIPRIGQEVVVDFLEGDPDRPLIIGRVNNADQMPPYALPDKQTQSGIKSRSSKNGGTANFNEIRFEDQKGSEMVTIHAEKDMETTVEHDDTQTVQNDRVITVSGKHTETITKDTAITIDQGNHSLTLNQGNKSTRLKMGNDAIKIDLGKSETEAMQSIELKVGQSSIKLDQMGVTIKGMTIKIEGQIQVEVKGLMTQVNGDAMLTLKGGITMIN
ncbi:MAG TPA: type VI secretion system tip protein VgrG [Bryobacteraceae bacterium]